MYSSLRMSSPQRQGYDTLGAFSRMAGNVNTAPMHFDDIMRNGQPQAGTFFTGGKEGIKDFLKIRLRDPATAIGNVHLSPIRIVLAADFVA